MQLNENLYYVTHKGDTVLYARQHTNLNDEQEQRTDHLIGIGRLVTEAQKQEQPHRNLTYVITE